VAQADLPEAAFTRSLHLEALALERDGDLPGATAEGQQGLTRRV
jgi:hypothetical protein